MWKNIGVKLAKGLGKFITHELQKANEKAVVSSSFDEPNVYKIDLAAEEYVKKFVEHEQIPTIVLSEDSEIYKPAIEPTAVMIIDPLDGSSNAAREVPIYTTSVAIGSLELQKQFSLDRVKVGIVYNPVTDNLYIAEKGQGATRNGIRLQTRKGRSLQDWYVGAIFKLPSAQDLSFFAKFKSFRCLGCATEHLCAISRGDYDAYIAFDEKLRTFDIAAAGLILQEAGGVITDISGGNLVSGSRDKINFLASASPEAHQTILHLLHGNSLYNRRNRT